MKYKPTVWLLMTSRMRGPLKEYVGDVRGLLKKAKPIYKDLLSKVEGISDENPMSSNITMSFVIVSIWLASERELTPQQMSSVIDKMLDWGLLRFVCGRVDMNTEKGIKAFGRMMKSSKEWADGHPQDWNTWDFHFDENLHRDGFYYHFTHCPIADFCKKHGLEKITPILCNIDFTTMGMMHSVLHRQGTIASGAKLCDYWTVGDQVKDPQ